MKNTHNPNYNKNKRLHRKFLRKHRGLRNRKQK